jgi:hypothetical protein
VIDVYGASIKGLYGNINGIETIGICGAMALQPHIG